jgi:hypothetical protein
LPQTSLGVRVQVRRRSGCHFRTCAPPVGPAWRAQAVAGPDGPAEALAPRHERSEWKDEALEARVAADRQVRVLDRGTYRELAVDAGDLVRRGGRGGGGRIPGRAVRPRAWWSSRRLRCGGYAWSLPGWADGCSPGMPAPLIGMSCHLTGQHIERGFACLCPS